MAYARACKYGCGTQLLGFDEEQRKYKEHPTGELHTKERCEQAKSKGGQVLAQIKTPNLSEPSSFALQKSEDIKAAQLQRKKENDQLIIALRNLTKAILFDISRRYGDEPKQLEQDIGFEQYREDKFSFQDEVV